MKKTVEYNTRKMLLGVKTVQYLLSSLNSIGNEAMDNPELNLEKILKDFIIEAQVLNKLAMLRAIITEPFKDFPEIEDDSFLETIYDKIEYWHPKNQNYTKDDISE